MRADRLVAALLILQRRERVTAAELAEQLEVSVPTARRDLEALSAAGVPVYPQPGRGGGWSLLGGARTDLSGLNADEVRALFILTGPSTKLTPEARKALRKLLAAVPATFRAGAEAAAASTIIDRRSWGDQEPEPPVGLDVLRDAVITRRRVELSYRRRDGTASKRTIDPYGLVDRGAVWYLIAGTDNGQRTFRLDRIDGTFVSDEVFEPPEQFSLEDEWSRIVDEMEAPRHNVTATVLIDPTLAHVLHAQFGTHCKASEPIGDLAQLDVSAPNAQIIAEQLAGWGHRVNVIAPESVRTTLAQIGRQLTRQYAES